MGHDQRQNFAADEGERTGWALRVHVERNQGIAAAAAAAAAAAVVAVIKPITILITGYVCSIYVLACVTFAL